MPSFAETDLALIKNAYIGKRANQELRFEFNNIFNHPNLGKVDPVCRMLNLEKPEASRYLDGFNLPEINFLAKC